MGGGLPLETGGAGEQGEGVRSPRETGGGLVPAGFASPPPPPPGGARSAGRWSAVLGRDSARLGRSRGSRAGLLPPGLVLERGAPFDGSGAAGPGQGWHPGEPPVPPWGSPAPACPKGEVGERAELPRDYPGCACSSCAPSGSRSALSRE